MKHFFEVAGMFLIPFLMVLIPILIGQRYGIWRIKRSPDLQKFLLARWLARHLVFWLLCWLSHFRSLPAGTKHAKNYCLMKLQISGLPGSGRE